MAYREPSPKPSLPPTGRTIQRAKLPRELREQLEGLARAHAAGRTETIGAGQAERVLFEDGTIWFPKGIEKDNPAIFAVLGFGIATLALGILSLGALGEPPPYPFYLPVGAVVAAAVTVRFWRVHWRRHAAAVREIAMGTVATPSLLALLAYDEVVVIPKHRIEDLEVVTHRRQNGSTHRVHVVFVGDDDERITRYVGFLYGPPSQESEAKDAMHVLREWLSAEDEP